MKTLKIVLLTILLSLFMSSCTDLINSDDELMIDTIEKVDTKAEYTGDGTGQCSGKDC
jgi:hypothetical protein